MRSGVPIALHITACLDFGGVETHLRIIAEADDKRYRHSFCAIMSGGREEKRVQLTGAPVSVLNVYPWRHPVRAIIQLMRVIGKTRPSIVHTHGLEGNLFGLVAAALCRVPVRIGEEVGIPDRSGKLRAFMSGVYLVAHRAVGVSEAVKSWLVSSGEVPARKVVKLYNPVQMSERRAVARRPNDPLCVAFVGRLDPVKNLPALISAMPLLHKDLNVELHLIGEGDQRPELERLVQALGLQDRVHLLGFRSDPTEILSKCHLYVQPSLAEGFGIAVVEAMSCGLPAIVSNRGGMAEIVEHGQTGWVVENVSSVALAEAISVAARMDGEQLAAYGLAARGSVRARFSTDRYILQLEKLYDDLSASAAARLPT